MRALEKYTMLIITLPVKKKNAGGTIFFILNFKFSILFFLAFLCTDIPSQFTVNKIMII